MKTNILIITGFVMLSAIQIYVPASMILEQESLLRSGNVFKFKTAPVDPNDPFRGKYITLRFEQDHIILPGDTTELSDNQEVFVTLSTDREGFARIENISDTRPENESDWVTARTGGIYFREDSITVFINFDFTRFYMEELKAPEAEKIYAEGQIDPQKNTWAVVRVREGKAALEDVMIDGISIREIAATALEDKKK